MNQTKVFSLALAVSCALSGIAQAGHEIVDAGKKQVMVEEPERLHGSVSAGYSTKYIFRGTNLMPSSDGMVYADAHVSYGGFTLGVWFGSQMGSAQVQGARAIGEGGGGGAGGSFGANTIGNFAGGKQSNVSAPVPGQGADIFDAALALIDYQPLDRGEDGVISGDELLGYAAGNFDAFLNNIESLFGLPGFFLPYTIDDERAFLDALGINTPKNITQFETDSTVTQERFNEIDLYLQYSFSLGPVDITVGNIFFYIDRESRTRVTFREYFASEDARDLVTFLTNFADLPNRVGHPEDLLINGGDKVSKVFVSQEDEQFDRVFISLSTSRIPYISPRLTYYHTIYSEGSTAENDLRVVRNDEKGGYFEAKVNAEFPIIKDRLNFDPYALVSYSTGDRSDKDGAPLYGWNHIQAGAELVFQVTDTFRLVPQINWMGRIADPNPGTNEDEWWGGAKAEVIF